jgi:hypothetical protein
MSSVISSDKFLMLKYKGLTPGYQASGSLKLPTFQGPDPDFTEVSCHESIDIYIYRLPVNGA